MRTNHWLGAAVGAGVIAGAVLMAPSAQASPHPASHKTVVKVVVKSKSAPNRGRVIVQHHGDSHDHHGAGHHGHHAPPPPPKPAHQEHHHHHGYPGGREACVTMNAHAERGGHRIEGRATNGVTPHAGVKAGVYVSKDGKNWNKVGETTTGKDGGFRYKVTGHSGEQVKAVVAGGRGTGATHSAPKRLERTKH